MMFVLRQMDKKEKRNFERLYYCLDHHDRDIGNIKEILRGVEDSLKNSNGAFAGLIKHLFPEQAEDKTEQNVYKVKKIFSKAKRRTSIRHRGKLYSSK